MVVLTGAEFNEKFNGVKFFKLLSDNLKHNKFTYVHGLNCDQNFHPDVLCGKGLYFLEESCILKWLGYKKNLKYIAVVTVPTDATVCIETDKFKADKIIIDIDKMIPISSLPIFTNVESCRNLILNDPTLFKFFSVQTEDICKCSLVHPTNFRYIKHKSQELKKLALSLDGYLLDDIAPNERTPELCEIAVKKNGYALQYIENQTDELCKLALKQTCFSVCYIKNLTKELIKYALDVAPQQLVPELYRLHFLKLNDDEIFEYAVKINGNTHSVKSNAL